MNFKVGDEVFIDFCDEPKKAIIEKVWGKTGRYKFNFIEGGGWTISEEAVYSSLKEYFECKIVKLQTRINLLKVNLEFTENELKKLKDNEK